MNTVHLCMSSLEIIEFNTLAICKEISQKTFDFLNSILLSTEWQVWYQSWSVHMHNGTPFSIWSDANNAKWRRHIIKRAPGIPNSFGYHHIIALDITFSRAKILNWLMALKCVFALLLSNVHFPLMMESKLTKYDNRIPRCNICHVTVSGK